MLLSPPAETTTSRPATNWRRVGVALLAGLAVGFGFEPFALWPLLLLGVAALSLLCRGRRPRQGFAIGYVFGLGMLTVSIGWVQVIAVPVAIALVAFESLFFGLLGIGLALASRLRWWPLWSAAVWTTCEFAYSRIPFDGFGWSRLGYAMVDTPLAGTLAFVGVSGLSFLTALAAQGLAAAVLAWPRGDRRRIVATGVGLTTLAIVIGLAARAWQPEPEAGTAGSVQVGIVQGNVDGVGLYAIGRARAVTNNHLSETVGLMAKVNSGQGLARPDFLLWPENSTDIDPTRDPQTRLTVQNAVAVAAVPILVGAVMQGPGEDERQTSALWWTPDGSIEARTDKQNLVPFGEYIPFRDQLLPLIPMLELVGSQGVPGTGPGVLDVTLNDGRQVRIGNVICFELAYDDTVAAATDSSQLFVVQSNNATYLGTGQLDQQFAITRARAMETRREVAIATTNALSGFVDRNGTIVWSTKAGTSDSTVVEMPLRTARTPAMVIGSQLSWALAGLGLLGVGMALLSRRRASK
ncbi:apolipoprotein N-acyltransferase [Naumannella halotolerans]|uniref:Apolipoprotein N-acyltransferase n=1 Tax=Naumannella halotolerans TaxID=993414 RepID=A0A4R7J9V9_9ACTN|nr:apolipoprotein N-acyltransferase [Naumannella halotolerans]TDT33387.1 apolipoprotein N-acyltransferase [Naumannella halotolerans]